MAVVFIDEKLKNNFSEELASQFLELFKLIEAKDSFEKFYRLSLMNRLFNGVDLDFENSLIEKFKVAKLYLLFRMNAVLLIR